MRINIQNGILAGWQGERVTPQAGELARKVVYAPDGRMAGEIVYLRRRSPQGSDYGWVPAHRRGMRLRNQVDAILLLPSDDS